MYMDIYCRYWEQKSQRDESRYNLLIGDEFRMREYILSKDLRRINKFDFFFHEILKIFWNLCAAPQNNIA